MSEKFSIGTKNPQKTNKKTKIKSIRIKYLTKENLRPNQTLIKDTPKFFSLIFNNFLRLLAEKKKYMHMKFKQNLQRFGNYLT